MPFEDSELYKAMMKDGGSLEEVNRTLKAATYGPLRGNTGETYVHLAATTELTSGCEGSLVTEQFYVLWEKLLSVCDLFQRDEDGKSGLDIMLANMDISALHRILGTHVKATDNAGNLKAFIQSSILSGKMSFLSPIISGCSDTAETREALQNCEAIEVDLKEAHQEIRSQGDVRKIMSLLSKRKLVEIQDLCGLPALHLAVVHEFIPLVEQLLKAFPEAINCTDHMGRTALHYAASMKSDNGQILVNLLANSDTSIRDIGGKNVNGYTDIPLDMTAFKKKYIKCIERVIAEERVFRVHAAVLCGDLRSVKMALDRREHAVEADSSKLTPLHKAVVMKNIQIIRWLAQQFPLALNTIGIKGMTPMHFAAAITKDIYEEMKTYGGDTSICDSNGHSSDYYLSHPSELPLDMMVLKVDLEMNPPSRPVSGMLKEQHKHTPSTAKHSEQVSEMKGVTSATIKEQAPSPQSLDAKYIADVVGVSLTVALAEVVEKRPWDPIEYLAQWLYKHKHNMDHQKKLMDAVANAAMEQHRIKMETEARIQRRKEALAFKKKEEEERKQAEEASRKQKETEELQKKAKESLHLAQAPELATVAEVSEEPDLQPISVPEIVNRDEEGLTQLHQLVGDNADTSAVEDVLSSSKMLFVERDGGGRTARDIAEAKGMADIVKLLDSHLVRLLKEGNFTCLNEIMESGYVSGEAIQKMIGEEELSKSVTEYLSSVKELHKKGRCMGEFLWKSDPVDPLVDNKEELHEFHLNIGITDMQRTYEIRVATLHRTIKDGNFRNMKQALERKSLVRARDALGCSALHHAVVQGQEEIVKYLLEEFPRTVYCRDNLNRTPLHLAYGLGDGHQKEITAMLIHAKAQEHALDCKGQRPTDYREFSREIQAMRESPGIMTNADGMQEPEVLGEQNGGDENESMNY